VTIVAMQGVLEGLLDEMFVVEGAAAIVECCFVIIKINVLLQQRLLLLNTMLLQFKVATFFEFIINEMPKLMKLL